MQESQGWSLGQGDLLEQGMANHSSILAWRISWTEEPGGLQPMGHKESDMSEQFSKHAHIWRMTFQEGVCMCMPLHKGMWIFCPEDNHGRPESLWTTTGKDEEVIWATKLEDDPSTCWGSWRPCFAPYNDPHWASLPGTPESDKLSLTCSLGCLILNIKTCLSLFPLPTSSTSQLEANSSSRLLRSGKPWIHLSFFSFTHGLHSIHQ